MFLLKEFHFFMLQKYQKKLLFFINNKLFRLNYDVFLLDII